MKRINVTKDYCKHCETYAVSIYKVYFDYDRRYGYVIKCDNCKRETFPHRFKIMSAIYWTLGLC